MIQRHEEKESNYIGRNFNCEIIKMIIKIGKIMGLLLEQFTNVNLYINLYINLGDFYQILHIKITLK